MKQVIQLDAAGYFVGPTPAHESPLEPGVFLIPAGAVDAPMPSIPEGKLAKWDGAWVYEDAPQPEQEPFQEPQPEPESEPEPEPIDPAILARLDRDLKLADSDKYALVDRWAAMSTAQQTAWAAYRQALRDVPEQPNFPSNIQWPNKPE